MRTFNTKNVIFSVVALLMTAVAFGQTTYSTYVCSQSKIQFSIPTSASYDQVEWVDGSGNVIAASSDVEIVTEGGAHKLRFKETSSYFQTTTNTFTEKEIKVRVSKTDEGCWSDLANYKVGVLPTPVLTMGDVTNYCADAPTASSVTATVATITGLPAEVEFAYTWKKDGGALGSESASSASKYVSTLSYTSPSNTTSVEYTASAAYSGINLVGTCASNTATATVASYATPNQPTITVGGW